MKYHGGSMNNEERELLTNDKYPSRFKPGLSGNPSGRPKSDATIRELARQHTESALSALVEVIQDKKAPPSARVHAATALLDRGWGKPPQYIENLNVGVTLQDWLRQLADRDEQLARENSDAITVEASQTAGSVET